MIFALPAMTDAYVRMLQASGDLTGEIVLDGPAARDAGMEGIAVGASRENPAGDFTVNVSDLASDNAQTIRLVCLAWVRSGDLTFTAARNRVVQLVGFADAALSADRTLGGTVSTAWITDGVFDQELDDTGILVTIEFRIEGTLF